MIQQRAYLLRNDLGDFIGIIAFDTARSEPIEALRVAWGTVTIVTKELDAFDLASITRKGGYPVFTYSHEGA